jgi:hypothetical protein
MRLDLQPVFQPECDTYSTRMISDTDSDLRISVDREIAEAELQDLQTFETS